jgi:putative ABC transport system permease protein
MKLSFFHIVRRSLLFNLKGIVYQIIIIIILTAVITGSLMTGKSVRTSLKKTSVERLGNTGILISSGIRYFDPSLVKRIGDNAGVKCIGLLEIDGYCQSFTSGQTAPQVKIFAVDDDFFPFQGNEEIKIRKGEAAINERLADYLQLKQGDELIIRFKSISDIPADAPFSPGKDATGSIVLKATKILIPQESGNFSIGISQLTPLNVFINRSDLSDSNNKIPKINRLLFDSHQNLTIADVSKSLSQRLTPEDIGLSLRLIPKTGGYEIISDRIFIDQLQVEEITNIPLKSYPVITYLANSIAKGSRFTPYSFVSALDPLLYKGIPERNGIIINKWLAEDLSAVEGDTIHLTWYSPDPLNRLAEQGSDFIVSQIVNMNGVWSDSLLMPQFPGIAGSESCTDWDAGVSIKMDLIRDKDEEYWNKFRGTPKAFINYEKGKELWGNNFGPATSIRFDNGITENEIRSDFNRSIDPSKSGLTINDLPKESSEAANKSVDFSTLFLSLGFFIILSAMILMILVVSAFFESKKQEITTLYSIGFSNNDIEKLLLLETIIIALTGAAIGSFAGIFLNQLIIKALNSVWQGAVQTNTLVAGFDVASLLIGFSTGMLIIIVILKVKSARYLKYLRRPETSKLLKPSGKKNIILFFILFSASVLIFILSLIISDSATMLSFAAGILVFGAMIMLTRQYYIGSHKTGIYSFRKKSQVSGSYFAFNPSQAIAPVLFLAAGLFAVIITGVNRMNISGNMLEPSGGTGGYLLWGEASVPVRSNINNSAGRKEFGLDESEFEKLSVMQIRKTSGNDASCLNLNHISSPPLLAVDPQEFINKGSFSFAEKMKSLKKINPWSALNYPSANGTVFGIADQTVLQYGLKIKVGDTLKIRTENGQILNVVIAAGLKSSVFQGYVLIGSENFIKYFPSVSGSQIFLVDGNPGLLDMYKNTLSDRLSEFGVHFESAADRLSSFFIVTNTYLSVFTILGGIGMILGVIGLGFVLLRNFNQRKRDFGLMMAAGFSVSNIRAIVFEEQTLILLSGTLTGLFAALVATRPSIMNNSAIPWKTILVMVILILAAGFTALAISVRSIKRDTLMSRIRKE